jgi:hypothetical protein
MELFIDNEGRFSDKGWNFREDWVEALSRKIRYVRSARREIRSLSRSAAFRA